MNFEKIEENKQILREFKEGKPCVICGRVIPNSGLILKEEFDLEESFNLTQRAPFWSKQRIMQELERREIVCHHCIPKTSIRKRNKRKLLQTVNPVPEPVSPKLEKPASDAIRIVLHDSPVSLLTPQERLIRTQLVNNIKRSGST